MPRPVPPELLTRKGALPAVIDLTLVCIDEKGIGYKSHDYHEEPSAITLEADGRSIGSFKVCSRCGDVNPPGAY